LRTAIHSALEQAYGELSDLERGILRELSEGAGRELSGGQLAQLLGLSHHGPVNLAMARLAKRLAANAGVEPPKRRDGTPRWWNLIATGRWSDDGGKYLWKLRPQFREIVQKLRGIQAAADDSVKTGQEESGAVADAPVSPAEKLAALFPDPRVRTDMIAIFAESMRFIRENKSGWCHVRLFGRKLRLFAGRLIVLTLEDQEVWLTTASSSESEGLSRLQAWRWDTGEYGQYRRVPSRNGYYAPGLDGGRDWPVIHRLHLSYLEHVLVDGIAPDRRTIAKHDAELMEYIDTAAPRIGSLRDGRGELPPDPEVSAFEGDARMYAHFRRERNVTLVQAKRDQAQNSEGQLQCEACGFVTQLTYPGLEGDICEVHHRTPLGEFEEAETRLRDLAILCPSCHRAIHRTRPLMSVEEFHERLAGSGRSTRKSLREEHPNTRNARGNLESLEDGGK
jgi:predicted HNH restriction endonuclease